MKIPCDFNFQTYPFDKHHCKIWIYELRYYDEAVNFTITKLYTDSQIIEHNDIHSTIELSTLKLPVKVMASIDKDKEYPSNGVISLIIERDSLDLLLGSFYIPTGIFAALSIGSYIISPELVSKI